MATDDDDDNDDDADDDADDGLGGDGGACPSPQTIESEKKRNRYIHAFFFVVKERGPEIPSGTRETQTNPKQKVRQAVGLSREMFCRIIGSTMKKTT